ncbi:MAG: M48 family metalloprotease [Burkholderiales bacterium]|nr:M48 family metalloprotease [Burkholderiales bacterium]
MTSRPKVRRRRRRQSSSKVGRASHVGQVAAIRGDATGWHWQVKLANRTEINARNPHGGRMPVNTGLLTMVGRSDDELAAILGHEMAHALREHGREKTTMAASKELMKLPSRTIMKKYENPLLRSSELHDKAIDPLLTLPHSREGAGIQGHLTLAFHPPRAGCAIANAGVAAAGGAAVV